MPPSLRNLATVASLFQFYLGSEKAIDYPDVLLINSQDALALLPVNNPIGKATYDFFHCVSILDLQPRGFLGEVRDKFWESLICGVVVSKARFVRNIDPNDLKTYASKSLVKELESTTRISTDLSLVKFFLWTPENGPDQAWEFEAGVDPSELLQHNFDPKRPTKFLSHGWNSDIGFCDRFVQAYYDDPEMQYNIIGVDYHPLATWDNYFVAASNAVNVGKHAGQVVGVDLLINGLGQSPDLIHAIGHSLGAHLVGHFGRAIKELGGVAISRVTGLDPAKPWFDLSDESNKISKFDADFVDIIHTNSGFLLDGRLSIFEELGDVDFYPNGGRHQPGCKDACVGIVCFEINIWDLFKGSCSHGRSYEYYVESIVDLSIGLKFISKSCDSWDHFESEECHEDVQPIPMGEGLHKDMLKKSSRKTPPKFFLTTSEEPPFAHLSTIG